MACFPECLKTASVDCQGRRLMLSTQGNKQFPEAHSLHPQCEACAKEEADGLRDEIAALTNSRKPL